MKNNNTNKQSAMQKDDPKRKIFGANTLQLNADDCSLLIGNIVEKGISQHNNPIQPPKVTVLPFPVARHRSHGPHWGRVTESIANDSNEDDEVNDLTAYGQISAIAKPVQRKKKKSLQLSQWRKSILSDDANEIDEIGGNSYAKKTRKQKKDGQEVGIDKKRIPRDASMPDKPQKEEAVEHNVGFSLPPSNKLGEEAMLIDTDIRESNRDIGSTLMKTEAGRTESLYDNSVASAQLDKIENTYPAPGEMLSKREQKASAIVSNSTLIDSGNGQRSMSLEGEIDAENWARLKGMSPEEIQEAQTEIMQKLDPALINLLKKRGQEKLKQKNLPRNDKVVNDEISNFLSECQSTKSANESLHVEGHIQDALTVNSPTDTKSSPDTDLVQDLGAGKSSLWNMWSERVEAVRRLRFSLEGNIVSDESETGDITADNVISAVSLTERDYLRTEGDPAAGGYTIEEAVQLTRSVIPGQRALALHLLASVLDKALCNIQQNEVGCTIKDAKLIHKSTNWEAVWAYALGPEPELVLSLRMCLDDNHSSVVLACARVIQCALSYGLNEGFFDIVENIPEYNNCIFTGPVFRSKPEIESGFLLGGFWKYNAKSSNILTFTEDLIDDETEGKHTIQDDITVAGQDFTAGLVRMGLLPRMRYLLEAENNAALEDSIISILVAVARHSPTCANAIMKCHGLVNTIIRKFSMADAMEINPMKIKSVTLLKVLAQVDKKNCLEFIKNGSFQAITYHLFRYTSSLDHWIKSGKESCQLSSALIAEQLRFWRCCISYGLCISYFSDIFPALCLWLSPPALRKLQESNVLNEFLSISREAYLVLEALARNLPVLYSMNHHSNQISYVDVDESETWSWNFVTPMVDLALKWIAAEKDLLVSEYTEKRKGMSGFSFQEFSNSSFLWVFSAVLHMLSTVLKRVKPEETGVTTENGGHVPFLPEFVPKVGLVIISNLFFSTNGAEEGAVVENSTFIEQLCCLRKQSEHESCLAAVCCLHGLLRIITSIDNLISLAKSGMHSRSAEHVFSREGKFLEDGILKRSLVDWRYAVDIFMQLVSSEWQLVQSIEIFGRGGPAPGVGLGWGNSGGGFWSISVLLAQADARLLIYMLAIFQITSSAELPTDEQMASATQKVNSVLGACVTFAPSDRVMLEKAFEILFQVPVLQHLGFSIQRFLKSKKRKSFHWEYKEDEYLFFSEKLASHFKSRWLSVKKKLKATKEESSSKNKSFKSSALLGTIHEDVEALHTIGLDHSCTSLTTEWAHQRLSLPMHWFLSPISTISYEKNTGIQINNDIVEVAKAGLFFLLAMEAMSASLPTGVCSPIYRVPLVWKIHSLSVILIVGMDVLEDNKSRDVYEALQDMYGQLLDEAMNGTSKYSMEDDVNLLPDKSVMEFLRFKSEIHESYSTFLEILVEQFAAVSYGDLIFGRQIAVYLHRCAEATVRLNAWIALSNARVLEILPPLEKCIAEADGYLEPVEDNEDILEAYVKSWVSGALDRSVTRMSMAYHLVLHHVSSFIFLVHSHDKVSLRNKLVKSLLRDCSQKPKHKAMVLELVKYSKVSTARSAGDGGLSLQSTINEKRFEVLREACERDSNLLPEVENLRYMHVRELNSMQ